MYGRSQKFAECDIKLQCSFFLISLLPVAPSLAETVGAESAEFYIRKPTRENARSGEKARRGVARRKRTNENAPSEYRGVREFALNQWANSTGTLVSALTTNHESFPATLTNITTISEKPAKIGVHFKGSRPTRESDAKSKVTSKTRARFTRTRLQIQSLLDTTV